MFGWPLENLAARAAECGLQGSLGLSALWPGEFPELAATDFLTASLHAMSTKNAAKAQSRTPCAGDMSAACLGQSCDRSSWRWRRSQDRPGQASACRSALRADLALSRAAKPAGYISKSIPRRKVQKLRKAIPKQQRSLPRQLASERRACSI